MPETELLIGNYLEYSGISICEAKSNFLIRSFVSLLKHLIENRRYL